MISVRRARAEDAPRLALVGAATFLESYAHLLPVDDILAHVGRQHVAEVYARWLGDPACGCWIAEHAPGAAPVGYLVATPPDLPLADLGPADWEIRRIYLLHRFQKGGLGRRLMEEVALDARERGIRRLLLGVYSQNPEALDFYARMGFTQAGTRSFRVGANDYHDFILQRVP